MITLEDALEAWGEAILARERGDAVVAEQIERCLLARLRELEKANEAAGLKFMDITGMSTENVAAMILAKTGEVPLQ